MLRAPVSLGCSPVNLGEINLSFVNGANNFKLNAGFLM